MYKLIRPALFTFDSEQAHDLVTVLGGAIGKIPFGFMLGVKNRAELKTELFGLKFSSPVGLAAGFDKGAKLFAALSQLGFGHLEFGTVTSEAQPGNPQPRIFRLVDDNALINRMGFPSEGADLVLPRITNHYNKKNRPVIGVNIGKAKNISIDDAADNYALLCSKFASVSDYITVNVSSPNTPDLRKLQEKPRLLEIFNKINSVKGNKPVLLKLSPDLNNSDLQDVVDVAIESNISGIIATNTTLSREGLKTSIDEVGGMSGKPLFMKSLHFVETLSKLLQGRIPIIGAGGIFTGTDALKMICSGASMVQVYTALIYEGPFLIEKINSEIAEVIKVLGCSKVADLVGSTELARLLKKGP